MKFSVTVLAILAGLAIPRSAAAKPPQVIPEPMLVNLFALTEASSTLRVCADSSAYTALPTGKKRLLRRLQQRIDGLVKTMAAKFDDDLFAFFTSANNFQRADAARTNLDRTAFG